MTPPLLDPYSRSLRLEGWIELLCAERSGYVDLSAHNNEFTWRVIHLPCLPGRARVREAQPERRSSFRQIADNLNNLDQVP